MLLAQETRVTDVLPGVKVVTVRLDVGHVIEIRGGQLHGRSLEVPEGADVDSLHNRQCSLARTAAWQYRGRGWARPARSYRR